MYVLPNFEFYYSRFFTTFFKMNMCNKLMQENITINLTISDVVLTPLTCASLINEIIKALIYEKSQIPYPYNSLKNIVCKKRKDSKENETCNFTAKKYYTVASKAYDAIEDIMENNRKELQNPANVVSEILIIFGTTPLNPKQKFFIKIPKATHHHIEANHVHSNLKQQQCILRKLFLSEDWLKATNVKLPLTNMYIMLKKTDKSPCSENFLINRQYNISNKNNVVFNITYENLKPFLCCDKLLIFEEQKMDTKNIATNELNEQDELNNSSEEIWFQSKTFFSGFKDCFINKVHASELW